MIVQKYGGTSVGTPEKIKRVAARIASARSGEPVVVVVSAMGDMTDELVNLARQVTQAHHERELDVLLSAGERISMALLSMALRDLGLEAISFTGSQAGIITDESHTRARILEIRPTRILEELDRGKVVIVAGFQGVSRKKEITTLGRGGSDTTAVALAASLGASRCEVYTDVAGVFSADPRVVPKARRYSELPLSLVSELAVQGAQVMHPRSLEIAREKGFSLFVGMAHPPKAGEPKAGQKEYGPKEYGTMLTPEKPNQTGLELPKVAAIASRLGLRHLRVAATEGPRFLNELSNESVLAQELEIGQGGEVSCLISEEDCPGFIRRWENSASASELATLALVGFQLQNSAGTPRELLEVLTSQGIKPVRLTVHPQSITVWLSGAKAPPGADNGLADQVRQAVRIAHEHFIGNQGS